MKVVQVAASEPLCRATRRLALPIGRPVVVVVGGADGVGADDATQIDSFVKEVLVPVIRDIGATLVDGGTDSGVMRSVGRAVAHAGITTPLVGVAVAALVQNGAGSTPLEKHHTHVVLVNGTDWGDESSALAEMASLLAAGAPAVTVVLNGGTVTKHDVEHSLRLGRPVIAVEASGRLAEELAARPPDGVLALDANLPAIEQRRALTGLLAPNAR